MNINNIPLGDPYILLSWLNMKLRNECESLRELCEIYEVSEKMVNDKIEAVGYIYEKKMNQFISKNTFK